MKVEITKLPREITTFNNSKTFVVEVLKSKLKILLVAGAPSPDVSFIINSIKSDHNLTISSVIELSGDTFTESSSVEERITNADILFLIGFPAKTSSESLIGKVNEAIVNQQIPCFISLGTNIDFNRLKAMEDNLPFYVKNISEDFIQAQPVVTYVGNGLLKNSSTQYPSEWNKLPPVLISGTEFLPKSGSETVSEIKIKNVTVDKPLIITNKTGSNRSIALLAKDIWRWKLQMSSDKSHIFDSFISNCIKWLNTSSKQKQFNLKTTKKIYTVGETVEFIAQVYDDIFNPVDNAEVNIKLANQNNSYSVKLNAVGNGLYSGTFETGIKGDYRFEGSAILNNKKISSEVGYFSIGDTEIEKINLQMNKDLLLLLAGLNNGQYSYGRVWFQTYKNRSRHGS